MLAGGVEDQDGGDGIKGLGGEFDVYLGVGAFAGLCEFEGFVVGIG
jgi:hypothetical protein